MTRIEPRKIESAHLVAILSLMASCAPGCSSCSSQRAVDAPHDEGSDSGQPGSSDGSAAQPDRSDATASLVVSYDPIWHKTTPAEFPVVLQGARPPCGTRCDVIAQTEPDSAPSDSPQTSDRWVVFRSSALAARASRPYVGTYAVDRKNGREYFIDDGGWLPDAWGAGYPSVDQDIILYSVDAPSEGYVILLNLASGDRKVVWRAPKDSADGGTSPGVYGTSLALPYAYWLYSGDYPDTLYRLDTRDGSLSSSTAIGNCEMISGTSTGLGACAAAGSGLIVVDFGKKSAGFIAQSGYQQTNGMLSVDGAYAVWIDFRDPGTKGEHGSYDNAWGGEVYERDFVGGTETRLTFDTPDQPRIKTAPWASGGAFAWIRHDSNPISSAYWYGHGPVMIKRPGRDPESLGADLGSPRPVDDGVIGVYLDPGGEHVWVVHVGYPTLDGGL